MTARSAFFTLILVVFASGCGGEPKRPTEQLTRAKTLVEQAEKSGAQRYASADLEQARNKLDAANKAFEKGKEDQANQLAAEAALDAEVANARAAAGEAQKAAQEVGKSTETLRQEAGRTNATGNTPQTPPPTPQSTPQPTPPTPQP
jgi:multidrug efflux pump subunit AcrA (membrane-fusion protein)